MIAHGVLRGKAGGRVMPQKPGLLARFAWRLATLNAPRRSERLVRVESWRLHLRTRQPGRRALEIDGPTFLTFDPVFRRWQRVHRLWVIIGDDWGWALMDCHAPPNADPDAVVRLIEERRRLHAEHFAALSREKRPGPLTALPSPPEPPVYGPAEDIS